MTRTLRLRTEVLTELTDDELGVVLGGTDIQTITGRITCATCQTCPIRGCF